MTNRSRHLAVWSCIFAASLLLAATPLLSQRQDAGPLLRATTRIVNLSIVATDASGKPIKNLRKNDFTILDDGHPQQITFFSAIDNSIPVHAFVPGANTYVNNPEPNGAPPSVTILLFDTLNSKWTTQGYGLNRVRDFLRQITPEDHIGIYVLGDDLLAIHRFSDNGSDVIAAIHRYDDRHASATARRAAKEQEAAGGETLDRFLDGKDNRYRFELNGLSKGADGYAVDKAAFAIQMTTASLEAIARELSTVAGRKTLIWVTDSVGLMDYFFRDNVDPILKGWRAKAGTDLPAIPAWQNSTDVEQMIRLMNNAGIAVYTVDARGLETEHLGFHRDASATPISSPTDPVTDLLARTPQPNGDLIALAQRTGGRAFFNRNDLETGIRRALDDSQYTYSIAYAPSHNKWKGEWRKIQVKVDRPGVTILARSGYFALPAPHPMSPKNRYAFLSEIAASPVDSAQLPFVVHISTPSKTTSDQILATVDIPPQSLATILAPEPNGHTVGHFEIEFMQIGAKNKLLDATQKQLDADLKPQEYAAMTRVGWSLTAHLPLKPGAQTLCVILHDENSDDVGSIHISLTGHNNALALSAH